MQYVVTLIRQEDRGILRVTLRADDPGDRRPRHLRPYLLNAMLDIPDGELQIDFLKTLDPEHHDIEITQYELGDQIQGDGLPANIPGRIERALIAGHAYSLVVFANGLPEQDFSIGSIRLRAEDHAHRAYPLHMFIQARP